MIISIVNATAYRLEVPCPNQSNPQLTGAAERVHVNGQ
jgi:hypothetical protein